MFIDVLGAFVLIAMLVFVYWAVLTSIIAFVVYPEMFSDIVVYSSRIMLANMQGVTNKIIHSLVSIF